MPAAKTVTKVTARGTGSAYSNPTPVLLLRYRAKAMETTKNFAMSTNHATVSQFYVDIIQIYNVIVCILTP